MLAAPAVRASTIWDGPEVSFTKTPGGDPTLAANQDRLTDNVWITRDVTRGLFNAAAETLQGPGSPAGTLWAVGTTNDLGSLTFETWLDLFGLAGPFTGPPNAVGEDFVVHLVDDDIYLDLQLTAWGQGGAAGGTFSYVRSSPAVPEPSSLAAALLAGLGGLSRRRTR